MNEEALAHWGLSRQKQTYIYIYIYSIYLFKDVSRAQIWPVDNELKAVSKDAILSYIPAITRILFLEGITEHENTGLTKFPLEIQTPNLSSCASIS